MRLIAIKSSTGVSAEQTACRSAPPGCSVPVHISVSRRSSCSASPISRSQSRVDFALGDANASNSLSCRSGNSGRWSCRLSDCRLYRIRRVAPRRRARSCQWKRRCRRPALRPLTTRPRCSSCRACPSQLSPVVNGRARGWGPKARDANPLPSSVHGREASQGCRLRRPPRS